MKHDCVFHSSTGREHVIMGKCWKTLLGLCTLSLLTKFIAFTANILARTQLVHYKQVDSTTALSFIQRYVSMKIQRIVWKLHGVSRSFTKECVIDRQLTKGMKKLSTFQMMLQQVLVDSLKMLNYHYSLDIFKKKLRRTTWKTMFSFETEQKINLWMIGKKHTEISASTLC